MNPVSWNHPAPRRSNDVHRHIHTYSNIFKQFQTYIILHNITYSNTGKLWKACLLSTRMMSPARTGLVHAGPSLLLSNLDVVPRCATCISSTCLNLCVILEYSRYLFAIIPGKLSKAKRHETFSLYVL